MSVRMRFRTLFVSLAAILLAQMALAEAFEGTVTQRHISVSKAVLKELLGGAEPGQPEQIFAIPLERVLTLGEQGRSGVEVKSATVRIKGTKVRVDRAAGKSGEGYMIIDAATGRSDFVMPGEKRYVEWTKADREALSAQLEGMQQAIQDQLDSLPPEQRRQMETVMERLTGTERPTAQPLNQTRTINGMSVAGYAVRSAREQSVGWVTREHPALLAAFKAVSESQRGSASKGAQSASETLAAHGLPLLVQTLTADDYQIEEMIDITPTSVPDNLFAVPAGFAKQTPPELAGGGDAPPSGANPKPQSKKKP